MTKVRVLKYDSDTVFTTNNKILLETFKYKPTLMCDQSSMPKVNPTEEDYIASDINGFGDTIGSVTNKATNMISLRASFEPESDEYKRLTERIDTMMNFQQNAIDRIKGVVARPVPNEWLKYSLSKPKDEDDDDVLRDKEINRNVAAEIKPWFFIYRYSELKSKLDKYMKSVKKNCKIRFGKSLDDLYAIDNKTEDEEAFIYNYEKYMPISRSPGTMNRICWRIEKEFSSLNVLPNVTFDYSILKSNATYTQEEYDLLSQLYMDYNKSMQVFLKGIKHNDSSKDERDEFVRMLKETFTNECVCVCQNHESMVNALIDVCYSSNKNKSFVWEMAGEDIFQNILKNNNQIISYPVKDDDGEIEFCGHFFSIESKKIGGGINDDFE